VKDDARQRKLRKVLAALNPISTVLSWHCVMCKKDYEGEKYCHGCGTGIYSIERSPEMIL